MITYGAKLYSARHLTPVCALTWVQAGCVGGHVMAHQQYGFEGVGKEGGVTAKGEFVMPAQLDLDSMQGIALGREERVKRYRKKRLQRGRPEQVEHVKYTKRQAFACTRPRVQGKFVKLQHRAPVASTGE
eukprot:scaffold853_cov386-Prasinococcus_capsulatus_cf.AAC.3